jgi:hypothetical protein
MKKEIGKIPIIYNILINTKKSIKHTLQYLKNTKIATRKWLLDDIEEEINYRWGDIDTN